MRPSLLKAAHALVSGAARQETPGRSKNTSRKRRQHRDLSAALPRISCRTCWRWQSSCAFLYGKAHEWRLRVLRGRKSGYASVEMTKGRVALRWESGLGQKVLFITLGGPQAHDNSVETFPRKVRGTADPSASVEMTKGEGGRFHGRAARAEGVFHQLGWAAGP
jgi:hypothetical protein